MRRAIKPSPPPSPRSSASVMAMIRDPRVLHVYRDHTIFKMPPEPVVEVPLTVVVTVNEVDQLVDSLRSLIVQDYSHFNIIVACVSPKHSEAVEGLIARHKKFLPPTKLFALKSAGWPADALNGVLPLIQTEYWSWLQAADILHPKALAVVANAILTDEADYYSTCRYKMQVNKIARPPALPVAPSDKLFWSGIAFPYSRLTTYRLSALAKVGGFLSYDRYPDDTAWVVAYKMKAAGCRFHHIPLAVYFERTRKGGDNVISPIEYRRALLLQHWPSHYVEETDKEAVDQMLDRIEEEEGRGSMAMKDLS